MAEPPRSDDAGLAEFERRWRDRGIVVVVLLVAVVAALALLVVDDAAVDMAPWAALAFLVVGGAYGLNVVAQERRARRGLRALLAEREKAAAISARVDALEDLQRAARDLLAADDLEAVFDRLLASARALTDADSGIVLLRVGDELTVAAGAGAQAPDRGEAFAVDEGLAGTVLRTGEALVIGRGAPWGAATGVSSIAAPMRLPDRAVGVLVVTRDAQQAAFGSSELAIISLFADHAALAVRNASRLDGERRAGRELRGKADALREEITGLRESLDERDAQDATRAEDLRASLAVTSGYVDLLRERGDGFDAERRRSLLDDVRRELAAMRARLDRSDEA